MSFRAQRGIFVAAHEILYSASLRFVQNDMSGAAPAPPEGGGVFLACPLCPSDISPVSGGNPRFLHTNARS